jgi:hypothetical protein
MKDTGFSHGGFSGNAPTGPLVVAYASVSELYAEIDLAVGYYEVSGVGITYWDGAEFFPYLPLSAPVPMESVVGTYPEIYVDNIGLTNMITTDLDFDGVTGSEIEVGTAWSVV